jgi:putative FmdB family regulatory protein
MPLYDYRCTQCGRVSEVRHGFDENHDEPCPACGAPVRRVFSAAPVLFKGSGFYVTDSRRSRAGSGTDATKTKAEEKSETSAEGSKPKTESSSESKGDSKTSESAA